MSPGKCAIEALEQTPVRLPFLSPHHPLDLGLVLPSCVLRVDAHRDVHFAICLENPGQRLAQNTSY